MQTTQVGSPEIGLPPEMLVKAHLEQSVSTILRLDQRGINDPLEHIRAEDEAFSAIHNYCDMQGVGADEEGLETRKRFAVVIDQLIRSGDTDALKEVTSSSVHGFLRKHDADELSREVELTESDQTRFYSSRTDKGSFSVSPNAQRQISQETPERVRPKRRFRKIIGAIAAVATVGAAVVFGVSRGDNEPVTSNDSVPTFADADSTTTTTTVLDRTTTTSVTSPVETPNSQEMPVPEGVAPFTEEPELAMDIATDDVILQVEAGGNAWDAIETYAVGTSEADANEGLQLEIGRLLPKIATENNIVNLGEINPGTYIVIGAEDAAKLQAAGVQTIG